ncbi:HlyD family secretion protein [Caulobacter sp. S45]|uniref:HlyD family secretion protein n=1 Tax=Caulobacter sp. S45 TaxID=1641861 RepID=UPI001576E791|nr:HlyD family secretion protein [Caulobacter sp. S45]
MSEDKPHDPRSTGSDPKQDQKPDDKKGGDKKADKAEKPPVWPFFVAAVIVLGFVGVVLVSLFAPHSVVGTDDARVALHFSTVAPRVSGQVVEVAVNDNQPVRAGQLLVRLDERDDLTAVQRAEAILQRDEAQVGNTDAQIRRQPALIAQAQSTIPSAQARLVLAQQNTRRYRNLAATGAGTQQDRQQAEASLKQAQADVTGAQAQTIAAEQQLTILRADHDSAQATVREDRTQLAQARLNLSYTRITAPLDGLVGQRTVQVGDFIAPGGALMTVMPLDAAYIEANYREVALRRVRPGQHVRIHLDAYDVNLGGVVDSLAPATGATFAAVAPENATGNFTKIVQRLAVKIDVLPHQPLARLLRVGLSVETYIDTHLADVAADERQHPAALR